MWYNAKMAGEEMSDEEKKEIDIARIKNNLSPLFFPVSDYL